MCVVLRGFLPCLANGRGLLLRLWLWRSQWQVAGVVLGSRRAVHPALVAHCAESALPDQRGLFASGSDCCDVPSIAGCLSLS